MNRPLLVAALAGGLALLGGNLPCRGESLVFDYDDFGPQAIAYEAIGFQWFQWNAHGDPDPRKTDPIKVVVYWDEPLRKVKKAYPVEPRDKKDFRYLSYERALSHLRRAIDELPGAGRLENTMIRLVEAKTGPSGQSGRRSEP
jgi:hypothetical protein